MCRLLGVIANRAVDLEFSLERFKSFGKEHPDGWGVGWYEDNQPQHKREPVPAHKSPKLPGLAAHARSRVFLCHVRKGTRGGPKEGNCHPFRFEKWLFAHNGTVCDSTLGGIRDSLTVRHKVAIEGDTDSEVYFHWILQGIEQCGGDVISGLKVSLASLHEYSALNFLLSDGRSLFAFREARINEDHYSLYYLERDPQRPWPDRLRSRQVSALIEIKALRGEKAVLFCSEKLTGVVEEWKDIQLGELLMVSEDLRPRRVPVLPPRRH